NGVIYEGEWALSRRHGHGKLTMPDLGIYEGGWKEGKKHGQGTFAFVEGGKYEGEWANGMCNGQGTRTFANGYKYVGEWKDFAATGGWYYWEKGKKTWSYMDENWEWVHKDSKPR
ncbi:MAG: MORN repeat-containing protein, partial [Planctomycetota bacterium]